MMRAEPIQMEWERTGKGVDIGPGMRDNGVMRRYRMGREENIVAKNLIVYYSRRGENFWNGRIRNIAKGNTETVAGFIQKAVGGDLFEIETVKEYAADYYACTEEAKKELGEGARPELKRYFETLEGYENILSAGRAGGELIPWRYFLSSKSWTLPGKRSWRL